MEETLKRLAGDREAIQRELERNTRHMQQAAHEALSLGYHAPTIARLLGVAKRTVYLWTR